MLKTCLLNPLFTEPIDRKSERYFVRSGSRWPASYTKPTGRVGRYIPFPFYLAYAAAILERSSFPVTVADAVAENLSTETVLASVRDERPDLVVYETTTPTLRRDLELARQIKAAVPKAEIALCGPHATTFPREVLQEEASIDYVLLYEYENTLHELVAKRSGGEDLTSLAGIAYRSDGEIVLQPQYQPIEPLDQLPFPARHLFPAPGRQNLHAYWDGFCQHRPAVQMHASRGCPFRCDFCLWIQVMYQDGKYRTFSPRRVVDEMEEAARRFGAKEIYFDDDDFTISKKHVLGICGEIRARGVRVPWSCMGDAVVPDQEMIDAMADAGCVGMKFGVESAAPQILARLGKPVDLDRVRQVARWCSRRHIKTHATITFGLWEETRETMEMNLAFVKDLDVDSVQFSITSPFPGTRYFQEMEEKGRLKSRNWEDYDGSRSAVVAFPHLSLKEIQGCCERAPARWIVAKVRDPKWIARQIRYLLRVARGQGLIGLKGRLQRVREILWG
jgi:radical SAM superfamily enzyme YgiQ (UPF0313 family)